MSVLSSELVDEESVKERMIKFAEEEIFTGT